MTRIGFLLSFFLLLAPTLLNGFPFVYYDTGFFLFYANHLFSSAGYLFRPLTYSLMLGAFHSVFLMVIFQSGCLNVLIYKTAETLKLSLEGHYFAIFLAMIFTPLAIYSNLVLTDIFIAIQVLALFNFIYSTSRSGWKIFFACAFVIASVAHYSNLILSLVVMLVAFFIKSKRKFAALLFIPLLVLPLLHFMAWQNFTVTKSAYFFLFSRFTALNVSQVYLAKKCRTDELKLCRVVGEGFDPWNWSSKSVIGANQKEFEEELQKVCWGILEDPKLMLTFVTKSAVNWGRQLILFSRPPENTIDDPVLKENLEEFNNFESKMFTRQFFRNVDKSIQTFLQEALSQFYFINIILSILSFTIFYRKLSQIQKRFFTLVIGFLISNAFICGVLTEPNDRYQGRLILLFPTFIIYILVDRLILVLNKRLTGRAHSPQTMS